jgi:hypothetical protein
MTTDKAPFSLAPDGEVFANDILERAEELINAGIWEGLEGVRVRTWMRNFETAENGTGNATFTTSFISFLSGWTRTRNKRSRTTRRRCLF